MLEDDVARLQAEGESLSLLEIERQIAGFEGKVTQSLGEISRKIDGIEKHGAGEASAVTAPVVEAAQMPTEPVPAAQAPIFAEVAQLPPAALPDAHEGEAPGILGGLAHKVADFAKGAVGGLRSDDVDALGNPDGGVPVAETAEASAAHTPIGSHTQAVEERRAQAAPALAVAG